MSSILSWTAARLKLGGLSVTCEEFTNAVIPATINLHTKPGLRIVVRSRDQVDVVAITQSDSFEMNLATEVMPTVDRFLGRALMIQQY